MGDTKIQTALQQRSRAPLSSRGDKQTHVLSMESSNCNAVVMQSFLWNIDKEHLVKNWGWGERSGNVCKRKLAKDLMEVGRQRTKRIDSPNK